MKISNDILYVGVNDHDIDLFEGHYIVPEGMAYNSYVVKGEKTAVMDSVDAHFADEWIGKVKEAADAPDYLVIQHMEPDHSGSIMGFMEAFPDAKIVSSQKAFTMMANFFEGEDFADRRVVVKEGDTLDLGGRALSFITAPMVHWPEVIMTYDATDKVLFSADAFGRFGALDEIGETSEEDDDWACEARRYYFGIVGKYGPQVQAVLKKAAKLDIETICALHGPVLVSDLGYYLGLYDTWSKYESESKGVVIAYTSVYGNTKKAVELLAEKLEAKGVPEVEVTDLARDDIAEAVEDAFRYDTVVFATTTFNNGIFPFMREFIDSLVERNYQNKRLAFIENGSWAPQAAKVMKGMLEGCKNMTYCENDVKIVSALNDDSRAQLEALAEELAAAYK
ncbi:MAG: FprA family A-type flavoprotein [Mogibacterium sp.]|nr:FprA family A-type flavoprotein [Mogibacterium sp.]MBR3331071.1 FprA family A-type flavoprotein [Mogibacterium sp.]